MSLTHLLGNLGCGYPKAARVEPGESVVFLNLPLLLWLAEFWPTQWCTPRGNTPWDHRSYFVAQKWSDTCIGWWTLAKDYHFFCSFFMIFHDFPLKHLDLKLRILAVLHGKAGTFEDCDLDLPSLATWYKLWCRDVEVVEIDREQTTWYPSRWLAQTLRTLRIFEIRPLPHPANQCVKIQQSIHPSICLLRSGEQQRQQKLAVSGFSERGDRRAVS